MTLRAQSPSYCLSTFVRKHNTKRENNLNKWLKLEIFEKFLQSSDEEVQWKVR